uniref:Secreted protein n=1 Tax=Arundo donax TaxID=35708 RepID=A0A0A9B4D5_ARUDO
MRNLCWRKLSHQLLLVLALRIMFNSRAFNTGTRDLIGYRHIWRIVIDQPRRVICKSLGPFRQLGEACMRLSWRKGLYTS